MIKRAIIVDDEEYMRIQIREKLTQYFQEEIMVVAEASSVENGVKVIDTLKPDIVFLDIQLSDGTGFDIVSQLENKNFHLIFVTGFDHQAIKAIKVGALDYVLKPIDDDDFILAVQKAITQDNSSIELQQHIEASHIHYTGIEQKRIVLKTSNTYYSVLENDIIYCKADGNYTSIYVVQQENIIVSKSIKKIEELLSESEFVRCHQSYIVNKNHIIKYNVNGTLTTKFDVKVPVSSRKKDNLLKRVFK